MLCCFVFVFALVFVFSSSVCSLVMVWRCIVSLSLSCVICFVLCCFCVVFCTRSIDGMLCVIVFYSVVLYWMFRKDSDCTAL